MFKNTTRRGLALGAALSLVVTGLAAASAQAAGEVVLVPSAGTSYTTLVTETFTLQASLAPGQVPSTAEQLKYKIDKAAGSTVSYGVSTSSSVNLGSTLNAASTSVIVAATGAGALTQNFVAVEVASADSSSPSVDVTVTAFIDSNNNSSLDAGEFNTARTVSFKKYSDVSSVVTLTQPLQGDTSVKGTATLTGINRDQVQSAVEAILTTGGATQGAVSVSADASFTVGSQTIGATTTVSAVVTVGTNQVGAASAVLTATAAAVKAVTASAVTGDNAKGTNVRLNSSFAVAGNVKNGTTSTASAVAGVAVSAKVTTSATLTTTVTVTVNGTTYTTSAALAAASFALTSDASGNATLNVTTAGLAANDKLSFVFASQNVTATTLELTSVEAAYSVVADGTGYQTVAPSGAVNLTYSVKDQFGVAVPAGHRLAVAFDGTTKYPVINAGVTSVAFTATSSTTTATYNASADQLQKQNTSTLNWENVSATTGSDAVVAVKVTTVASKFDVAPTHSAAVSISRVVTTSPGLNNALQITGTVNHAGDTVTIAGAGVKFSEDGETVSVGSITVNAAGNGQFTVSAYVHTAGTANLTYTVGAATATSSVKVDAAAATEGKAITVTVVSGENAAPGSTVRAKVSLADEYGNPVAGTIAVAVAGPGFIGTLPTSTGATGDSAEFSILLGSGDTSGVITLTATYDADGAGSGAAITAVKTVTIGAVAAVDQKLTVGSFKGFVAIYTKNYTGSKLSAKVAGRWLVVNNLASFTRTVRLTGAGYTIKVDLFIDGKFVRSETVVTK